MTERVYEFNWDIIGDLQEGRPNLGDQVSLILYRVMQYTFYDVAAKQFGNEETDQLFYESGRIAGRFFFENFLKAYKDLPIDGFLEKIRAVLDENNIRYLRIDAVDVDAGEFAISVATGIEGAAFDPIKLAGCDYDTGFVEGILFKYAGKEFTAKTVNTTDVQDIVPKPDSLISLVPYRILQYTVRDVAEQKIGTQPCNQLFYDAGDVAGHLFFDSFLGEFKDLPLNGFIAELQRVLKELGVGVLRVEKADADKGEFTLTVSEDLDCSGLPDLGLEVCNYDEGFIAGIFYKYTGITFKAKEVDCWCSGDRTCRFQVSQA
jgi:predicted hydrocarbon binding protein